VWWRCLGRLRCRVPIIWVGTWREEKIICRHLRHTHGACVLRLSEEECHLLPSQFDFPNMLCCGGNHRQPSAVRVAAAVATVDLTTCAVDRSSLARRTSRWPPLQIVLVVSSHTTKKIATSVNKRPFQLLYTMRISDLSTTRTLPFEPSHDIVVRFVCGRQRTKRPSRRIFPP